MSETFESVQGMTVDRLADKEEMRRCMCDAVRAWLHASMGSGGPVTDSVKLLLLAGSAPAYVAWFNRVFDECYPRAVLREQDPSGLVGLEWDATWRATLAPVWKAIESFDGIVHHQDWLNDLMIEFARAWTEARLGSQAAGDDKAKEEPLPTSHEFSKHSSTGYYLEGCRPLSAGDLERATRHCLGTLCDRSVGSVVFRREEGADDSVGSVLLMRSRKGAWDFPKGHPNDGEDDVAAATRETCEETGAPAACFRLLPEHHRDVGYSFVGALHDDRWRRHADFPDERKRPILVVHKTVRFFLGLTAPNVVEWPVEATAHTAEAAMVAWVPVDEARALLTHAESKAVFEELWRLSAGV